MIPANSRFCIQSAARRHCFMFLLPLSLRDSDRLVFVYKLL